MPASSLSPEARAALRSLRIAATNDYYGMNSALDPVEELLADAERRARSKLERNVPITVEQKFAAFRMFGFIPVTKQKQIAEDTHEVRVVRAGRRSGKTTLAAAEAAAVMVAKPGSQGWIVAPDYDLAYRCWEMLVQHLDSLAARGIVRYKHKRDTPDNMRIVLDNGSVCEGKSAEQADSLQGTWLDWLVMDEIAQIHDWVYTQILYPALRERNGWAFLIGTPLGEAWSEKEFRNQQRLAREKGEECTWAEYVYPTWENTVQFPGGRYDPKIVDMERTMGFDFFMEQVCALPQRSRYVVYKEFDNDAHMRHIGFDKKFPVYLAVDPSTGANPYGVVAIQDLTEQVHVIDEYYRINVIAQDVIDNLSQRPWWPNVEDCIVDDAWPQERQHWIRHKDTSHFAVRPSHKSAYITDSIPLVRKWLRDPVRYYHATLPLRNEKLAELFPGKAWEDLEVASQQQVMIRLEEDVARNHPEILLEASRLFVARHCVNLEDEFTGHVYIKRKKEDRNVSEVPMDHKNHLLDPLRYWLWAYKRHEGDSPYVARDYVMG